MGGGDLVMEDVRAAAEIFDVSITEEYREALRTRADRWVPANGGHETPFRTRNGLVLLYCWNPATGRHAYINVETDMEIDGYALAGCGL